ncbi:MAG: cytochrome c maturation protein CcmE [Pseudomonadota bacterium]
MNPKRRNRLLIIALVVCGVGAAVALALVALQENVNLFYSPTEVARGAVPKGQTFRVGGLVREGSVRRAGQGLTVSFDVTDGPHSVTVDYTGILPDLFREGQGIVAQGRLNPDGRFTADQVLAKHDENYMPPEVADALIKAEKEGALANPHSPQ